MRLKRSGQISAKPQNWIKLKSIRIAAAESKKTGESTTKTAGTETTDSTT